MFAGMIIGAERQWRKKLAGMRTMTLVTFGSCQFVSLSSLIQDDNSPTRIAAQVVSGIGFLAGGVILREGFSVTGINTAATLWCSAAVGSMIGAGFVTEGVVCAVILMLVNILLRNLSFKIDDYTVQREDDQTETIHYLSVIASNSSEVMLRTEIIQLLDKYCLTFTKFSCTDLAGKKVRLFLEIEVTRNGSLAINTIISELSQLSEVIEINQMTN
ncbi:MgtC/SapB family protein [Enterococcus ureilyticus]|uniref:MgtC/SapB family protein n=1 Tax=Enterococcus ureilyticus TaxID=1131292 RepID=UPI002456CDC4|nr:MgtC/SapB family protein [Enterococcus ureilyticus]